MGFHCQEAVGVDADFVQRRRSQGGSKCRRSCHDSDLAFPLVERRVHRTEAKTRAAAENELSYGFRFSPWHAGCWHWHAISVTAFASAQVALQYFLPYSGMQLQAGWAHFEGAVI